MEKVNKDNPNIKVGKVVEDMEAAFQIKLKPNAVPLSGLGP